MQTRSTRGIPNVCLPLLPPPRRGATADDTLHSLLAKAPPALIKHLLCHLGRDTTPFASASHICATVCFWSVDIEPPARPPASCICETFEGRHYLSQDVADETPWTEDLLRVQARYDAIRTPTPPEALLTPTVLLPHAGRRCAAEEP